MWEYELCEGFENQYKKFSRKHEREASAALSNVQTYIEVLNVTQNILIANQQSFVHQEPEGIVAIDERGAKKDKNGEQNASEKTGKMKATRLYVYAAMINKTVHLLGIGDKDSQKQDIENCRLKVRKIKKG